MAGPKLTFRAGTDPEAANWAYGLVGLASLGPIVALIAMAVPADHARRWAPFAAGMVVLVAVLVLLAVDLRRLRASAGHQVMAPRTSMVVTILATSGSALVLLASGLPMAIWAPVLMLPTCVQVLIGDRRMVLISLTVAALWAAVGIAVDPVDAGTSVAVAVLFAGSWLLVLGILRLESRVSTMGIAMSEQFAQLAEVAATAADEQAGLEAILDLAGGLLRARRLDLLRVGTDRFWRLGPSESVRRDLRKRTVRLAPGSGGWGYRNPSGGAFGSEPVIAAGPTPRSRRGPGAPRRPTRGGR